MDTCLPPTCIHIETEAFESKLGFRNTHESSNPRQLWMLILTSYSFLMR
uniref:Uncharacterized protein n=1 Tax=Rhizophora mucronata TaxID=61149 RepID=A0A2P2QH78_RHIMU